MKLKNFRPIVEIIILCIIAFLVHWSVFYFFFPSEETKFQYSLLEVYSFFSICALLITAVSIVVRKFSIDNVGQAFLLTTFIEMLLCFAVFYQELNTHENTSSEKANFIIVFLLFLAIETIVTIRILNKKQ